MGHATISNEIAQCYTIDQLIELVKCDREARAAREQTLTFPVEYLERDHTWHPSAIGGGGSLLERCIYRLAPEPEPTYRPYTGEEWKQCVGDWFQREFPKEVYMATGFARSKEGIFLFVGDRWYSPQGAFKLLKHCDQVTGKTSPCGVRIVQVPRSDI